MNWKRWCAVASLAAAPLLAVAPASAASHVSKAPACAERWSNSVKRGGDGYYQAKILSSCELVGVQAEVKCQPSGKGKDHDFYGPVVYYDGERTRATCKQSSFPVEAWAVVAKKAHEVWPKNTVTAVVRATFASCTWKVKSVIFPGIGGTSSSIAENDSCHWYYRARARCLDTVGAGHYAYGLWRNSTRNSSIAYCGKNYKLTESWFQKYRDGKYYEVYPNPAPGVAAVTQ